LSKRVDQLEAALAYALSAPPTKAGRRLKSERELEQALGLGRRQVNAAMNRLAERGLIVRQRGAGTFVRKLAALEAGALERGRSAWAQLSDIEAEALFHHESGPSESRLERHRPLHLAFWGDWLGSTTPRERALTEMARLVQRGGHTFSIHSIVQDKHVPQPVELVRRQLQQSPADGYLVVERWAEHFIEALGGRDVPIVLCGGGIDGPELALPRVYSSHRTIARAARVFADAGLNRIAHLGLFDPYHSIGVQRQRYQHAMAGLDLEPFKQELVHFQNASPDRSVANLLDRGGLPEAVYLSDDHLLPPLTAGLKQRGLTPGRDLALICLTNRGVTAMPDPGWSRFEMDLTRVAQLTVQALLNQLAEGDPCPCSLAVEAAWMPGTTHTLTDTASVSRPPGMIREMSPSRS